MESYDQRRRCQTTVESSSCAQRYFGKTAHQQRKEVSGQHKHRLLLSTIPLAEIAGQGEFGTRAGATLVRANFFWFPTNEFRREMRFHFGRARFPSAID